MSFKADFHWHIWFHFLFRCNVSYLNKYVLHTYRVPFVDFFRPCRGYTIFNYSIEPERYVAMYVRTFNVIIQTYAKSQSNYNNLLVSVIFCEWLLSLSSCKQKSLRSYFILVQHNAPRHVIDTHSHYTIYALSKNRLSSVFSRKLLNFYEWKAHP